MAMVMTQLRHRVAVTGSTGFIGMHLLRGLHAVGAEIVAIAAADKHIERLDGLPFPVEHSYRRRYLQSRRCDSAGEG